MPNIYIHVSANADETFVGPFPTLDAAIDWRAQIEPIEPDWHIRIFSQDAYHTNIEAHGPCPVYNPNNLMGIALLFLTPEPTIH